MTGSSSYEALRTGTTLLRAPTARVVRLSGEGARAAALWVLPSRLHLRDAQARQSLLLDASAHPVADVVVAADDEDYLLLLDGPGDPVAHVREHARGDVQVTSLEETHTLLELHGPWAWELAAAALGEDLLALPYLNFFRMDDALVLRAGRTGEYGYHLIVPNERVESVLGRLLERGPEVGLREVDADTVALASFENWFFDARFAPPHTTPAELGLSWRLAPDHGDTERDYLGREALEARRGSVARRQACLLAAGEVHVADRVQLGGRDVGEITRVAFSPSRRQWFAAALVEPRLTFAGIELRTERGVSVRTAAPPLVDNQSLYVDPRRHSYRSRDEVRFGTLVRAEESA